MITNHKEKILKELEVKDTLHVQIMKNTLI